MTATLLTGRSDIRVPVQGRTEDELTGGSSPIQLDESQRLAIERVADWIDLRAVDPKAPQVFRLGGHAGSGKTTIIREIVDRFAHLDVTVCTLAGKAASVLRSKGIERAINLHQIFYQPLTEVMEQRQYLRQQLQMMILADPAKVPAIQREIEELERNMFVPVEEISADLVIVDEASMVSGKVAEDLKRYGRPILAVGDPAQLPPVDRNGTIPPLFADQVPDVTLTGTHRGAGQEDIAAAALAARTHQPMPKQIIVPGDYDLTAYDRVLVHSNDARWTTLREIRQALGKPTTRPVSGDEIVVWRNDRSRAVFNGSSLLVHEVEDRDDLGWMVEFTDLTSGIRQTDLIAKGGFRGRQELDDLATGRKPRAIVASFGEVLTVHKAQGSEFDRVLVVGHPSPKNTPALFRSQWRYTAVTRAKQMVHVSGQVWREPVVLPAADPWGGRS